MQIRTEVHNWQRVSKKDQEGTECREKILELLGKFREAQMQQDLLIEKEKLRLDAFRNCINEDTTNRIKKRLTFFQKLNKQHEALLEHVRQDIQDCRAICKRLNDSNGRLVMVVHNNCRKNHKSIGVWLILKGDTDFRSFSKVTHCNRNGLIK